MVWEVKDSRRWNINSSSAVSLRWGCCWPRFREFNSIGKCDGGQWEEGALSPETPSAEERPCLLQPFQERKWQISSFDVLPIPSPACIMLPWAAAHQAGEKHRLFQPVLLPKLNNVFLQLQFAWQPGRRVECKWRRLSSHNLPPLTPCCTWLLALRVWISKRGADISQVLCNPRGSSRRDHQMRQPHKQWAFFYMKDILLLMRCSL